LEKVSLLSWFHLNPQMPRSLFKIEVRSLLFAAALVAQLDAGTPAIDAISSRMKGFVEAREVAGAVTLVADADRIHHLSAEGLSDVENKKPMVADSLFWIASMTKPITGTSVMMMHEAGLLSIDDPVSKFLPEFADLKDADGNKVSITIKQCLTHSSGLSELTSEETKGVTTLAALTPLIARKPVLFPPGSKWQYCQSSINTAGRVVEVVSGKSFPEFLQSRLLGPLGMKDTSFYLTEAQAARLATTHKRTDSGGLEKAPLTFLNGKPPTSQDRYPMPNGGLFSTAADYAKFAQMILRGGELAGTRFLKPESVKLMTTVQSGDLVTGFTPGNGWGLGWCVVRTPQGVTEALSPGSFGHGGAFGTQVWIDPVKQRLYLLLVQRANFPNSDASDIRREFQNAAVANP
jgi:CubicO group peptidase (beta-lactamase class C family)